MASCSSKGQAGLVRGLILPPCALLPPPQAQSMVSQGMLNSSIPAAMPSTAALSMSPGMVCPHRIKGDMPQTPAKPAKPMTRCYGQHHPRGPANAHPECIEGADAVLGEGDQVTQDTVQELDKPGDQRGAA